jgi:hypothetical protein
LTDELVLLGLWSLLVREPQLVVADGDDVTMLQCMLLDQLAIDVGAIGAVQILEERIVENIDNQGVVPTDSGIVDTYIVIRETPNRVAFLRHVVFG